MWTASLYPLRLEAETPAEILEWNSAYLEKLSKCFFLKTSLSLGVNFGYEPPDSWSLGPNATVSSSIGKIVILYFRSETDLGFRSHSSLYSKDWQVVIGLVIGWSLVVDVGLGLGTSLALSLGAYLASGLDVSLAAGLGVGASAALGAGLVVGMRVGAGLSASLAAGLGIGISLGSRSRSASSEIGTEVLSTPIRLTRLLEV